MNRPSIIATVPVRSTRLDPSDRVLVVSQGTIADVPTDIRLTVKGLYFALQGGVGREPRTFGVNLNELAKLVGDAIEQRLAEEKTA